MMHWNYRVIRKQDIKSECSSYYIHEVYYREDGSIDSWTESLMKPHGETREELREDIRLFLQAFRRPVLDLQEVDGKQILIEDPDDSSINDGHYFEFMDRASVALDYIYQFLGSHPLLKKEPRIKELYRKTEEALADLYQEAGRIEFTRSGS